ncbi:MAG: NAD(P)/FAD-dependent oxidoreductase [Saprospiraceae bacterium]
MGLNIKDTNQKRLVIIGGGFAGIELAKRLNGKDIQVVILDKHNYHTFQPLLYQVATAGLEPGSIAYPLRKLFQKSDNSIFRMANVEKILTEENIILTNIGKLSYDYLVIATGSKTNYYSLEKEKEEMMAMKSIPQALNLRSLVLQNFENALLTNDLEYRKELMNVLIVGGGPTGVELAGAIAEMKRYVLPNDYPELDVSKMEIHLFEAAPRVLAVMSEEASAKSLKYLRDLGVNVHLKTRLNNFENNQVVLPNETVIRAETLIWTAGVKGALIDGIPESSLAGNRLKVNVHNQIEGFENIFALGDVAAMITEDTPRGHPMVAPVAIQQGYLLSKNIFKLIANQPMKPFAYKDKGSMATIGRNRAVVDLSFYKFQGLFAWFVWMFVHIMSLVGFRNKTSVFINWVYSYFTYNRALRLIIRPFRRN